MMCFCGVRKDVNILVLFLQITMQEAHNSGSLKVVPFLFMFSGEGFHALSGFKSHLRS